MLASKFDSKQTEHDARQYWPEQNFAPSGQGTPYCIMLPPPNVTGTLHMGHGFQHTLMDALIRYHRMLGDDTLWQPGTDHAGIATQMVVEKQLARDGLDRKTMGREAFEQRVWAWKETSGNTIVNQMKKLGTTCDWSRLRFTMDEGLSKAVTTAFVKLYEDGLIYRGTRLVNWDPVLQTALSDLEVLSEEEQGSMWHLKYPLASGWSGDATPSPSVPIPAGERDDNSLPPLGGRVGDEGATVPLCLIVATTRPETMLGDVAVAVNPEDERYKHLIGQKILLPLVNREIPIIADEYVDPAFGTGCVKMTPAHDFNDFEVCKRHEIAGINIFTKEAKLNDVVPEAYRGLTREVARKRIVQDLTELGLVEKIEPHKLQVPRSERSGAIVEPYLTEQWYVRMESLAKPALDVVEKNEIEFIPETWRNTYRQWLTNIQDWCISRQLWWGHRVPAWYDEAGNIYVAHTEQEAIEKAGGKKLHQDDDVLDTWFSSALWPFSTLGWPEKTPEFEKFYPTNVLVTGFDIIFFWVARMIMFGLYFTGKIPFKQVLFTGLIRDQDGQKMSKSKGNVLDPIDLIEGISLDDLLQKRTFGLMMESQAKTVEKATRKQFPEGIPAFGEDALRFTYCALATHGRDVRFDLERVEGARNFCNKLWNATRFIQMQLEKCDVTQLPQGFPTLDSLELPEQWIVSKLNNVIEVAHKYFTEFRFDLLAQTLYEFAWYEFCDWYIEFAKIRLNEKVDQAILQVLVNTLETILRLLHPIIPFITEDLWQHAIKPVLNLQGKTLMLEAYPRTCGEGSQIIPTAVAIIDQVKDIILGIRQVRNFYKIEPKKALPLVYVQDPLSATAEVFKHADLLMLIQQLAKVDELKLAANDQTFDETFGASTAIGSLRAFVSLQGLVDFEAEEKAKKEKALKEKTKLEAEKANLETRLQNADKVPEAVAQKWRERLKEIEASLGL
ncbi:MAG: valyl-tRNA synthetase [Gammaproteobacteria bacterium]|jgi:valyl-tRNA synthetase|nr:valyl-tRNA synthetase [Gammaproteobacteria bacterium]